MPGYGYGGTTPGGDIGDSSPAGGISSGDSHDLNDLLQGLSEFNRAGVSLVGRTSAPLPSDVAGSRLTEDQLKNTLVGRAAMKALNYVGGVFGAEFKPTVNPRTNLSGLTTTLHPLGTLLSLPSFAIGGPALASAVSSFGPGFDIGFSPFTDVPNAPPNQPGGGQEAIAQDRYGPMAPPDKQAIGLGIAKSPGVIAATAAAPALLSTANSTTAQAAAASQQPQFSNPLEAIGFVLNSLAAGVRGTELPIEKFRREQQVKQDKAHQQALDDFKIISQARDVLQSIPEDQRKPYVDQLAQLVGEDYRPVLEAAASSSGQEMQGEVWDYALAQSGGDVKQARKLAANSSFRKEAYATIDQQVQTPAIHKVQSLVQLMQQTPGLSDLLQKGPSGKPHITLGDLLQINQSLADSNPAKLDEAEARSLQRNWNSIADEIGLETPKLRQIAETAKIKAEVRTSKTAATEKPAFGNSEQGLALNTLMQYKQAVDSGQPVDPALEDQARVATHILQQQKFLRTPEGDLLTTTPGIPEGFPVPGSPGPKGNPTAEQLGTGPTVAKAQLPETSGNRIGLAIQAIDDAARILDEAQKTGETITGAVGQAKALGGGVARQVGVDVSDRARQLRTKVEEIKALAAPAVLGEKGRSLSDADRIRLDAIVGKIDYTMDDTALRGALSEVLKLLEKAGGAQAGGPADQIAVNPQTGEKLILRNGKWEPYSGK